MVNETVTTAKADTIDLPGILLGAESTCNVNSTCLELAKILVRVVNLDDDDEASLTFGSTSDALPVIVPAGGEIMLADEVGLDSSQRIPWSVLSVGADGVAVEVYLRGVWKNLCCE